MNIFSFPSCRFTTFLAKGREASLLLITGKSRLRRNVRRLGHQVTAEKGMIAASPGIISFPMMEPLIT